MNILYMYKYVCILERDKYANQADLRRYNKKVVSGKQNALTYIYTLNKQRDDVRVGAQN